MTGLARELAKTRLTSSSLKHELEMCDCLRQKIFCLKSSISSSNFIKSTFQECALMRIMNKSNNSGKTDGKKWQKPTYQRWKWIQFDNFSGPMEPLNAMVSSSTYLCYGKNALFDCYNGITLHKNDFSQPLSQPVRYSEPNFAQALCTKQGDRRAKADRADWRCLLL